jgi:hypothetical protein
MGQLPNPFNKELFLGVAKVSRIPEFWKSKNRKIGRRNPGTLKEKNPLVNSPGKL